MTKTTRAKLVLVKTKPKHARSKRLTDDDLAEMIAEATVDAYGPSEQVSGFYTMLAEHLDLPFSTHVLGIDVVVERTDGTRSEESHFRGCAGARDPLVNSPRGDFRGNARSHARGENRKARHGGAFGVCPR